MIGAAGFTTEECHYLLQLIRKDGERGPKSGFGYSDDPMVGKLQAKLSIALELAGRMGR